MKKTTSIALTLTLAAATAFAQHHDHAGHHPKMSNIAALRVQDLAAERRLQVRVGPLHLTANTHHDGIAQAVPGDFEVSFDGWITAYHPRLVDANGQPVPSRLLHHVAIWSASRPDFLCPNKEEHIFCAGGEMNDWPTLPGVGYRVRQGDRIRVDTMFHNPTDTAYPQTYLEVTMEYRLASDGPLASVYPTWLDVMECGNSGYDLAAGFTTTSAQFKLAYSGKLLGVGGHLHDYGQRLELKNLTRGEDVAMLDSTLDRQGRILEMPIVTFADRGGYPLAKGDVLRVTATYHNPGEELKQGAMGIVVGYFLPEKDEELAGLRKLPLAENRQSVGIFLELSADGTIRKARVARSLRKDLDEKALAAVKQWKFTPARKDGRPVAVQVMVDVFFCGDGLCDPQPSAEHHDH